MLRDGPLRVLLIDNLPLLRQALASELEHDAGLHVIGCSGQVEDIRQRLMQHHPEVIVFDLDLPRKDALDLLKNLHAHYPVPIIVCARGGPDHAVRAIKAIEHGAVEVVAKPSHCRGSTLRSYANELTYKIHNVARHARPVRPLPGRGTAPGMRAAGLDPGRYVCVLGASTGGTQAITRMLECVPADFPALVMVQHMPVGFTNSFAKRLNSLSALRVTEAVDGEVVGPGRAVVARGDRHLVVQGAGGTWRVHYTDDTLVNRHCPSVDVLFDSACAYGKQVVAILLTGMGSDGARGMARLHQAGAVTIAQDETSSVVYGMPKEAVKLGAVMRQAPPNEIPAAVTRLLKDVEHAAAAGRR